VFPVELTSICPFDFIEDPEIKAILSKKEINFEPCMVVKVLKKM